MIGCPSSVPPPRGPLALANRTCNQAVRPVTAVVGARGWEVGGCSLGGLADHFGTPLYVIDEATIVSACKAFREGLARHYPGETEVLYASKALCNTAINRLIHEQGLATEVVSGGELATVLAAGIPPSRIHYQGNAKSRKELAEGLAAGVGRFLIDNRDELTLLEALAVEQDCVADVLFRVAPGVEAHTHDFIKTGQADSKFGLYLPGDLDAAADQVKASPHLRYQGLQAHVGSQIFDIAPFVAAADIALGLVEMLRERYGLETLELDVGGGLGIAYVESDDPPGIDETLMEIARFVARRVEERGLPMPRLMVEPGRAIVGTAGCTVYEVATVKTHESGKRHVLVDGGMADNPRPITYGAEYSCDAISGAAATGPWSLAGKACEEGDVIIKEANLPDVNAQDRIVVWTTGAYTFSMSSNYNRLPRPAMVLVADGIAELVRERESYRDILALDRMPARWRSS